MKAYAMLIDRRYPNSGWHEIKPSKAKWLKQSCGRGIKVVVKPNGKRWREL